MVITFLMDKIRGLLVKYQIRLDEPIKSFGTYQVKAKLYTEIQGVVTVKVEEA